jgi:hypothetical protein
MVPLLRHTPSPPKNVLSIALSHCSKVILVSTEIYKIILKNTTFIHHITGRAMHEIGLKIKNY